MEGKPVTGPMNRLRIVSEYHQEIPQLQTAGKPTAP